MKGVENFCLIVIYFISFQVQSSKSKSCTSDDECKFEGKCVEGQCICIKNCSNLGVNWLCGIDGRYFMNKCYHLVESCEIQNQIDIVAAGPHPRCKDHSYHQSAIQSDDYSQYKLCNDSVPYCQNYGICLENNQSIRLCYCPSLFHGKRCENRRDDDEFNSPKRIFSERPTYTLNPTNITVILLLCVLSALFSSILTSAVCFRYSRIRLQKAFSQARGRNNKDDILIVDTMGLAA